VRFGRLVHVQAQCRRRNVDVHQRAGTLSPPYCRRVQSMGRAGWSLGEVGAGTLSETDSCDTATSTALAGDTPVD